ncbi:MAG: hypothetical protein NTW54_05220 [Bacteroidetes bacterium]|nr:hypothetical protein [Bacteroidota bacterium]
MINRLLTYPGSLLMKISNRRFFSVITSSTWKATLTLVIIVAFFSFPSYDAAFASQKMGKTWEFVFEQGKDPFTFHYSGYNSHTSNLAFRFVPAIVLNILHIDKLVPAFLFQFCTMVAFYLLLMTLFKRLFNDSTKAFIYALGICFIIEGNVYCNDARGMFDTLALDFYW